VKAVRLVLAIVLALVVQTTLARFALGGALAVDLVLVAVVFLGLSSGPVIGILAGTIGGLAQDALAIGMIGVGGLERSGIIGIGALAKTVVGFLSGIAGTQFIVSQMVPRFLVFVAATFLQAGVTAGLYTLLGLGASLRVYPTVTWQGVGNGLVGVVLFQAIEMLPGVIERRRASRGRMRVRRLRD
jgi:hypothetical protein